MICQEMEINSNVRKKSNPWEKYPTSMEDYQANRPWFDWMASLGAYDDDAIENDDDDDFDDDDE